MAIASGFNHFLSWKAQTAWGTKATGLTKTMVPLRGGSNFRPRAFQQPRGTVVQAIAKRANLYDISKLCEWRAQFELINPRLANDTLRDFLRSFFGLETTATGPPITKTFTISDPLVDGGTDAGSLLYGRALTLHEQCDKSDGTAIFADEVQDAVVSDLTITWEPDRPTVVEVGGMASDWQPGASDIAPSDPTGGLHTHQHVRESATAGIRIGTANPPTQNDELLASRVTLTMRNNIRYTPFLGNVSTQQARIAVRGGMVTAQLEVIGDVEDAIANEWDSSDASTAYNAKTGVNINILSEIGANEIFQFLASGATAAAWVDSVERTTPGEGPMQFTAHYTINPNALAEMYCKFTTVD